MGYKVRYTYIDDEYVVHEVVKEFENGYEAFGYAASLIVFSDCTDEELIDVELPDGTRAVYVGWLPDMEVRFINVDNPNEILWDCHYPEWEH